MVGATVAATLSLRRQPILLYYSSRVPRHYTYIYIFIRVVWSSFDHWYSVVSARSNYLKGTPVRYPVYTTTIYVHTHKQVDPFGQYLDVYLDTFVIT